VILLAIQAWRFLLQLRWVRRRVDEVRLRACKAAASRVDVQQQDHTEAAAVAAAAVAAAAVGAGYSHGRAVYGGTSGGGGGTSGGGGGTRGGGDGAVWLSGRQELLLLQEMGQLLGRWLQHVMDRLVRSGWSTFEQVRRAAGRQSCGSSSKCSRDG
jgi:hypothetical protein